MHKTITFIVFLVVCVSTAVAQPRTQTDRRIDTSVPLNTTVYERVERIEFQQLVTPAEYAKAVADLSRAMAAAEEARQRVAVMVPPGTPNPLDCMFHPWHQGCKELWRDVEVANGPAFAAAATSRPDGSGGPSPGSQFKIGGDIVRGWLVEKLLDKTWDTAVCLIKASGANDNDGWDGGSGLRRMGECFKSQTAPPSAKWTAWTNQDGPGGSGDFEEKQNLIKAGKLCAAPIAIECQTLNGVDWTQTGQAYICSLDRGGVCVNGSQKSGTACSDYQVRYLCP